MGQRRDLYSHSRTDRIDSCLCFWSKGYILMKKTNCLGLSLFACLTLTLIPYLLYNEDRK